MTHTPSPTWISQHQKSEETQGDIAFQELAITVREQPSPVSVLDAGFYDEESPSLVKKEANSIQR